VTDEEPWWAPLRRAFRAAIALIGHLFISLVLIGCFWVVEQVIRWLWQGEEPLLYGKVPLRYLFDTLDVAVFGVFIVWGVIEANWKLKG
jgi:hypothetical protein